MASVTRPLGARVIVDLIQTSLDDVERWRNAGLHLITDQQSQPKPTEGVILALGPDPMLTEVGLRVGVKVSFAAHAGVRKFIEGREYRVLELQEILDYTEEVQNEETDTLHPVTRGSDHNLALTEAVRSSEAEAIATRAQAGGVYASGPEPCTPERVREDKVSATPNTTSTGE